MHVDLAFIGNSREYAQYCELLEIVLVIDDTEATLDSIPGSALLRLSCPQCLWMSAGVRCVRRT